MESSLEIKGRPREVSEVNVGPTESPIKVVVGDEGADWDEKSSRSIEKPI